MGIKLLVITLSLFILGCPDSSLNQTLQKCTDKQFEKAQQETEWCIRHDVLLKVRCYEYALQRNCIGQKGASE